MSLPTTCFCSVCWVQSSSLFCFWAFKGTITKAVVNLLTKLLNRSRQIADQSTLRFVLGPLKHFLAISGLYLALMNLHPGAGWSDFFLKVYRIAVIILISIVLLRLCDCGLGQPVPAVWQAGGAGNRLNKTLMTLLKKAAKVLILIIAGIAVLSETGINVATLITGIGLGGLTIGAGGAGHRPEPVRRAGHPAG